MKPQEITIKFSVDVDEGALDAAKPELVPLRCFTYPFGHLLAMHFEPGVPVAPDRRRDRITLFFSTEAIVILGNSLTGVWDRLLAEEKQEGLITLGDDVRSILQAPYPGPPEE